MQKTHCINAKMMKRCYENGAVCNICRQDISFNLRIVFNYLLYRLIQLVLSERKKIIDNKKKLEICSSIEMVWVQNVIESIFQKEEQCWKCWNILEKKIHLIYWLWSSDNINLVETCKDRMLRTNFFIQLKKTMESSKIKFHYVILKHVEAANSQCHH